MKSVFTILILGIAAVARGAEKDDLQEDHKALQGIWICESVNGVKQEDAALVINGNVVTELPLRDPLKPAKSTFTLVKDGKLRGIDCQDKPGGTVYRGVYELHKDKLTICYSPDFQTRPIEMLRANDKGNAGDKGHIVAYTRQNPDAKSTSRPKSGQPAAADK